MRICKHAGLIAFIFLIINGCATHQSGFETPVVTISSFETLPSQGMLPQFKIGLHIINPNRTSLNLKGVAYTISLEGHKILTGVSNKMPVIDAYGEGDVTINAGVDLFNSIKFFNELIKNQTKKDLDYSFDAKLDIGAFYPVIRVNRKGTLSLIGKTAE